MKSSIRTPMDDPIRPRRSIKTEEADGLLIKEAHSIHVSCTRKPLTTIIIQFQKKKNCMEHMFITYHRGRL